METEMHTTISQCIAYCKEDGDWFEFGIPPEQGKRKDLDIVKNEILAGRSVDSVCVEQPMLYHMYGRTLNRIEEIAFRKKFRTEYTKGIWYYGKTGKGKSHNAFEDYSPDTHYIYNLNDNGYINCSQLR